MNRDAFSVIHEFLQATEAHERAELWASDARKRLDIATDEALKVFEANHWPKIVRHGWRGQFIVLDGDQAGPSLSILDSQWDSFSMRMPEATCDIEEMAMATVENQGSDR
jgi:hypothetical protein